MVESTSGADALASVLAQRTDFLRALSDGPLGKPALVEATGTSRSTVDRAIDDLEDSGVVVREDGEYRLTFTGATALAEFGAYRSRLAALERAHDVLGILPPEASVDPAVLEGATVRESPHYPNDVAFQDVIDLVRRGDRVRAVGPALPPRYLEDVRACVRENDLDLELIVTPTVVDMLGRSSCDGLHRLTRREEVTVYELTEPVPYALWIVETGAATHGGLVVYAENGVKGAIRNDTDAMTEWATATFRRYRDRSTRRDSLPDPDERGPAADASR